MPPLPPERDRRRLLPRTFVWLPVGLWTSALLVLLRFAVELAARHRAVGTATPEEAGIFLWETSRDLLELSWGALVAGPLVAALAFRFNRGPASRAVVTLLGAGVATAGVAAQAWSREAPGWRPELALDAPLVIFSVALLLVAVAVRVLDLGVRFVGPLEDAPGTLRPFMGGGAAAGALLVLALVAGVPTSFVVAPGREVLVPVRDLRRAPEAIAYAEATGATRPRSKALAPQLYAHSPGEARPALRCAPPATLRFDVASGATHLLAELAVDGDARRTLAAESTLPLRCDVLLDDVLALREEVRITTLGEFAVGDLDAGTWRPLGGPRGVPLAGVGEVELRLEVVGPRDPETAGTPAGAWVGLSPLVQVRRTRAGFTAPTRRRPSLFAVRFPGEADAPAGSWPITLDRAFGSELRALAIELLGSGAATATLASNRPGAEDGFETHLTDPADLGRWLESRAGVRSFLWLDLAEVVSVEPGVRVSAVLEAVRSAVAERNSGGDDTVWVLFDRDSTSARIVDPRDAPGLTNSALSPEILRRALAARALGTAPSVATAWERAARGLEPRR